MRNHSEEEMEDREWLSLSPCEAVTPDNRLRLSSRAVSTPSLALGTNLGETKKGLGLGWKPRYSHQSQQKTRILVRNHLFVAYPLEFSEILGRILRKYTLHKTG